ncbi:hypothetical protein HAX54_026193, partial [Datura stramonium]|nr:hypothetical protein [Datura stramonium]
MREFESFKEKFLIIILMGMDESNGKSKEKMGKWEPFMGVMRKGRANDEPCSRYN